MPGSYSYAGRNTTENECIRIRRISERKKHPHDIRKACEPKVQVWEPTFLVQRILRGYRRKNAKKIQEYIQNQLREDLEYDQMSLKEYIDPFTGEPVKQNKKK